MSVTKADEKDSHSQGSDLEKGGKTTAGTVDRTSQNSDPDGASANRDDGHELYELGLDETERNSPEKVTLRITHDEPPPYHSDPPPPYRPAAFKRSIREAKEQSSGNVDFMRRVVFGVCCGTVCCGIIIALNLAIPISMIVMGSIHLHSCPRRKYIPIYLLVGGCFGVARAIINIVEQVLKHVRARKARNSELPQKQGKPNPADGVVTCFLSAWFIAGCYWIYSIHGDYQSIDPDLPGYCHEVLYQFAFWLTTASFILMGIGLVLCCVMCIGMCIVAKSE